MTKSYFHFVLQHLPLCRERGVKKVLRVSCNGFICVYLGEAWNGTEKEIV